MTYPMGEHPPLPLDLIQLLHERARRLRAGLADLAWGAASVKAIDLFEQWKRQ